MSSTIQRTKAQAIFFLLGAVLVGGALGFTANRALSGGRDSGHQKSSRTELADRLELDAAQRAMLDSVLDDRNEQMKVLLAPMQPRMDSVRFAARAVIRARLTPGQQGLWDQILVEMSRENAGTAKR